MRKNIFISFKIIYPTVPNVTLYTKIKSIGCNLCIKHFWHAFAFKQIGIILFINLIVTRNDRDLVRKNMKKSYLSNLYRYYIDDFNQEYFTFIGLRTADRDLVIEKKV